MLAVFLVSATLLYLGFQRNQWKAASRHWFDSFDLGSEGLVIGRLCKSRHDGLFSAAGLTGSTVAGIEPQYREYLENLPLKEFAPYRSQPGFQADFFALLDRVSPWTPRENLGVYRALAAAATATALALLILWFHLEFGVLCAVVLLITTLYSGWLTVMGRSLWWCLGAYYLPWLCTAYGLLLERRTGWPFHRYSVALIAAAVLSKCLLNGFEFIATTVLMALVPFVYHAFCLDWPAGVLRARLTRAVAGIVLGASIGLCVLAFQLSRVDGTLTSGWSNIVDCLYRRTVGRQVQLGAGGVPERLPDLPETLARYLKGAIFDLNMLVNPREIGDPRPTLRFQFRQVIFLFVGATALALLAVRHRQLELDERRRILGLVAATWFSLLAPLSWFILFMGHATVHFHLDHVVWHMPFTLHGFALCGVVARVILRPPPGPGRGDDLWTRTVALTALMAGLALHAGAYARHTAGAAFTQFRGAFYLTQGQSRIFDARSLEGISSPLWILLLALGRRAGIEVELVSKLLGLAAGLACLALVMQVARKTSADPDGSPVWMVAGLWTACCAPFAFWSVGGLEVALYALALTALPVALHAKRGGLATCIGAVLALLRPEGALLALIALGYSGWHARRVAKDGTWHLGYVAVLVPALLMVPYLPVPVTLLAALAVGFRAHEGPLFALPPLLAVGAVCTTLAVGADSLPLHRLLTPLAPLSFLLAAAGLEIAMAQGRLLFPRTREAAILLVLLCAGKLASVPDPESGKLRLQSALAGLQEEVGAYLVRRTGRVAIGDSGRVAYRSRLEVLDFSESPSAGTAPTPGWVLDRRVEWIALLSIESAPGVPHGFSPRDDQLSREPRLATDYVLADIKRNQELKLEYRIFRRRDASGVRIDGPHDAR